MRRQNYVVHFLQRTFVGFLGVDVESRAAEVPGRKQTVQSLFIDKAAAGHIDHETARTHEGQTAEIEQRAAVFGLGAVQRDDVRPVHEGIKTQLGEILVVHERIVIGDFDAEWLKTLGNGMADAAKADDAHAVCRSGGCPCVFSIPRSGYRDPDEEPAGAG